MGLADWFKSKQHEIDTAYRDADELRHHYGEEALHWCKAGVVSAADAETRRALKRIEKVLTSKTGDRRHGIDNAAH